MWPELKEGPKPKRGCPFLLLRAVAGVVAVAGCLWLAVLR